MGKNEKTGEVDQLGANYVQFWYRCMQLLPSWSVFRAYIFLPVKKHDILSGNFEYFCQENPKTFSIEPRSEVLIKSEYKSLFSDR